MVVDTSAIIAISREEPGYEALVDTILATPSLIAAPAVLEYGMVLSNDFNDQVYPKVLELLRRLGVEIVPFTPEMAERAVAAFLRYGKGRHPASLNFGDCISYALAISTGRPLLWAGEDFALTDARPARH